MRERDRERVCVRVYVRVCVCVCACARVRVRVRVGGGGVPDSLVVLIFDRSTVANNTNRVTSCDPVPQLCCHEGKGASPELRQHVLGCRAADEVLIDFDSKGSCECRRQRLHASFEHELLQACTHN